METFDWLTFFVILVIFYFLWKATKKVTYVSKVESRNLFDGTQRIYRFNNNYGASVVCHSHSYGGKEDKFELIVLKNCNHCYNTPIAHDVIGWLKEKQVQDILTKIEKLPKG